MKGGHGFISFVKQRYCGNDLTFLYSALPPIPDMQIQYSLILKGTTKKFSAFFSRPVLIFQFRREVLWIETPRPRTCALFHRSASLRLSIGPSCDGLTSLEPLLWAAALFNINLKQQTCQIHLSGVSCSSTRCSPNSKPMWSMSLCLQNDFLSASLCNIFWDYEAWILTFRQAGSDAELMTIDKG